MGIDLKDFTSAFAHDSKGAGGTRAKALQTFRSLQTFAKSAKWGDTTPANITSKQLNGYLTHRATANSARGKPLSARSVQNEAAIIRRAVKGAQRSVGDLSDKKNNWGNARLGVPSASRKSAKPPMDPIVFAAAREKMSPAIGVIADLQRAVGLRAQEAVKSQNVKDWQSALTTAIAQNRGVYLHMTKDAGGKGAGRVTSMFHLAERMQF
jgi:Integrase